MVHWEAICTNPITGRRAWAVRHIPSGHYGDPYDWSMVVTRAHWLSRVALVSLMQGIDKGKRSKIEATLLDRGFRRAKSIRKGRWVTWDSNGRQRID